jgi:hypothetical protein
MSQETRTFDLLQSAYVLIPPVRAKGGHFADRRHLVTVRGGFDLKPVAPFDHDEMARSRESLEQHELFEFQGRLFSHEEEEKSRKNEQQTEIVPTEIGMYRIVD